jgi:DNA-directed RNA polymerase subunit RPC12/RpoP
MGTNSMAEIPLDFERRDFACPHCHKETAHDWPGATILFATAKCQHCGKRFLIVQDKPRAEE